MIAPAILAHAMMLVALVWIWEVWNWTDADRDFFGVALLLFAALGAGYILGAREDKITPFGAAALVALMLGIALLIWDVDCELPCDPRG